MKSSKLKFSTAFLIICFSYVVAAQPKPALDKVTIDKFLNANSSYRLLDSTPEGSAFSSPLPNKHYPTGYTPDKPHEFHIYRVKKSLEFDESIISVDCKDKTFQMSTPDKNGIFRIIVRNEKIPEAFISSYCMSDWSKEVKAARKEVKELMKLPSK